VCSAGNNQPTDSVLELGSKKSFGQKFEEKAGDKLKEKSWPEQAI
jgi:hypothetical protein